MGRKAAFPKSMTTQEKGKYDHFNRCVEFHGHRCPGLAIRFQAARALMYRLGVTRAPDEELVAIVETDACGADAIQVMTGCTFGKGNFIFRNYGKHAFALADRKKGRTVRVCLRPNALSSNPEDVALSKKVQNHTARPEELERYRSLKENRIQEILRSPFESLFKIEEILFEIPVGVFLSGKMNEGRESKSAILLQNRDMIHTVDRIVFQGEKHADFRARVVITYGIYEE